MGNAHFPNDFFIDLFFSLPSTVEPVHRQPVKNIAKSESEVTDDSVGATLDEINQLLGEDTDLFDEIGDEDLDFVTS